ncbi:MAG: glycosyltransferase family 1 protein, partial [Proteobacteria bacterium]|nr:glycosyltransferase family 1 protein [Pseudomonadota bacterium]
MVNNICMLSTHGYFDPIPQLGRTDTGGQVTYVIELAKALTTMGKKVDIYTRWFDQSKPQIDPVPDCPDVRVIRIPAGSWEFLPKEFIYDVLPELAKNMVNFIQDNNLDYDLYHGHYVDAGIVTLDVAKTMNKPAFFTAHSLGAWKKDQMGGDPIE